MQAELQIGHIVHLKSGSPNLKIVARDGENVTVEWLNEECVLEQMTLPGVCFRPAVEQVA